MIGWLGLSDAQRRAALIQAGQASGIGTKAIEKDWWVTLALRALFSGPYARYMIFKGGTSLSKCWNLVERFSGDLADLVSSTVARWDTDETSRRIELQVGRDLQWIRVNGTVVGGLAGLIIYTVAQLIG